MADLNPEIACLTQHLFGDDPAARGAVAAEHAVIVALDELSSRPDLDLLEFQRRLGLPAGWSWDDVSHLIDTGVCALEDVLRAADGGLS